MSIKKLMRNSWEVRDVAKLLQVYGQGKPYIMSVVQSDTCMYHHLVIVTNEIIVKGIISLNTSFN